MMPQVEKVHPAGVTSTGWRSLIFPVTLLKSSKEEKRDDALTLKLNSKIVISKGSEEPLTYSGLESSRLRWKILWLWMLRRWRISAQSEKCCAAEHMLVSDQRSGIDWAIAFFELVNFVWKYFLDLKHKSFCFKFHARFIYTMLAKR